MTHPHTPATPDTRSPARHDPVEGAANSLADDELDAVSGGTDALDVLAFFDRIGTAVSNALGLNKDGPPVQS